LGDWPSVRDDYVVLLRKGSVTRALRQPYHAEWRRQIKVKCRADKLRVQTWSVGGHVGAGLRDRPMTFEELAEGMRDFGWDFPEPD
jgi:hypothetical protein